MKDTSIKAKKWNVQVFRNVVHRKKRTLARLERVQRAMGSHTTKNLRREEEEIRDELERVMTQEELLSKQSQGTNFIKYGDHNSSWLHGKWKRDKKKEYKACMQVESEV